MPGLESVFVPASGAANPTQCTSTDTSLPARVLWVVATDPTSLVLAAQCHRTRQLVIFHQVPFRCQVRPPNRYHRVSSSFLSTAHRAASVADRPIAAASLVWLMAL
jgi:hypothetical protein